MRSADRAAAAVLLCVGLAGCVSTQTQAARVQLNDARIRAAQKPTRVAVAGSAVRVQSVSLIRSGHVSVFVVTVRNPGSRPVSDLPISVGARTGRRVLRFLNAQSGATDGYFRSHLAAIAPGQTSVWVYESGRRLPGRAQPFALVGDQAAATGSAATPSGGLPVIEAMPAARTATTAGAARLTVLVRNLSSVPQYQLPVYLVARRDGRVVAAAGQTLPFLAGDAGTHLSLRLLGRAGAAQLQALALPTTLQ